MTNESLVKAPPRHVDMIGVLGKRHVFSTLDKSGKPEDNIKELQETAGLAFPCRHVLPFLDLLRVPRAVVYQHLFDAAKEKLGGKIQKLSQEKLLEMLSTTIRFLGVNELKSIPLGILKKLSSNIPLKYLHFMAKNCKKDFIVDDIPTEVRQMVWLVDPTTFIAAIESSCKKWLDHQAASTDNSQRVLDDSISQICKYIGNSQKLFSNFANNCLKNSRVSQKSSSDLVARNEIENAQWCTLLRHVLVNLQRDKIRPLGKLREMAWQLNNFIRESDFLSQHRKESTEKRSFEHRLEQSNVMVSSIFSCVADIRRVFVASHERSKAHSMMKPVQAVKPLPTKAQSFVSNTKHLARDRKKYADMSFSDKLLSVWTKISNMDRQKVFARPVSEHDAPGYSSVVKTPMDLSTMLKKIPQNSGDETSGSVYKTLSEFEADLKLMFDNSYLYNAPGSPVLRYADRLWQAWLKNKPLVFGSEAATPNLSLNTAPAVIAAPAPPRLKIKSALLKSNAKIDKNDEPLSVDKDKPQHGNDDEKNNSSNAPSKDSNMSIKLKKTKIKHEKPSENNSNRKHTPSSLKTILKNALSHIWKVESNPEINGPYAGMFSTPVTEDVAPGYFSVVRHPMDLSTVRKRISSNSYQSVDEFEADLKLIDDNCKAYNEEGSVLCEISSNLWRFWVANRSLIEHNPDISYDELKPPKAIEGFDVKLEKSDKGKPKTTKQKAKSKKGQKESVEKTGDKRAAAESQNGNELIKKKKVDETPSNTPDKPTAEDLPVEKPLTAPEIDPQMHKKLKKAIDIMTQAESDERTAGSFAGVFSTPVTEAIAPGYFTYVKRPMDLSTIEQKVNTTSKQRCPYLSLDDFEKDLKLIFDNARAYNQPGSAVCQFGDNLWSFWCSNRRAIEKNPDVKYEDLQPPVAMQDQPSEVPERPWPVLAPMPEKKLDIEKGLLYEALERAIDFLSTEDDTDLFATDVNIPGYSDIIQKPRSLNFINSRLVKYKSVEAFEADVRLMFSNCIEFNEPNRDYFFSDLAVKMWNSWLQNREHILLDTEAVTNTASLKKKSSLPAPVEKKPAVKPSKKRKAVDEQDEDEEFMMEDEGGGGEGTAKKTAGITSEMLFDEESSDDDYQAVKKRPKKAASTASSSKQKAPEKKSTSKKLSSSQKATQGMKRGKAEFVPLVPLHRLSSTNIKKVEESPVSGHSPAPAASGKRDEKELTASNVSAQGPSRLSAAPVLSGPERIAFSRDMLRWSVSLLRDAQLQKMFKKQLCMWLISLGRRVASGGKLPFDDEMVKQCLWLCQVSVDESDEIYELKPDPFLLREVLPYILLYYLTLDKDSSPMTLSQCKKLLHDEFDFKQVTFEQKAESFAAEIFFMVVNNKENVDDEKNSTVDPLF